MEVDGGRRHLAFRLLPLASSVAVTSADVSVPRRDGERRAALSKVADGVAHAMAFPQLCRLACDMIATHLRAGFAAVGRCNGERVSTVAVNHGAPMTGPGPADGAASALWTAARTGSAARTAFGPGGRDGWPRHAAVEEVAVPLTVDGATWGAVMAAACDGAGIAPDAEGFMESMAHLLAVAIGHEEFRRELITHARTDGLTGLPNRRAFEERLDEEVTRAHRHGRRLALAIFDVDRFKAVNDTHGHTAGDDVLREVAVRLARMARVGDLVARLGGEEFAWLMTDTDARGAYAAIERARLAVADAPFPTVGDVTVSVGVADLGGGPSRDALYRNADAALYRAKHAGRNRTAAHRVAAPSPATTDDTGGAPPTPATCPGRPWKRSYQILSFRGAEPRSNEDATKDAVDGSAAKAIAPCARRALPPRAKPTAGVGARCAKEGSAPAMPIGADAGARWPWPINSPAHPAGNALATATVVVTRSPRSLRVATNAVSDEARP